LRLFVSRRLFCRWCDFCILFRTNLVLMSHIQAFCCNCWLFSAVRGSGHPLHLEVQSKSLVVASDALIAHMRSWEYFLWGDRNWILSLLDRSCAGGIIIGLTQRSYSESA
jgi:hypothetical protein